MSDTELCSLLLGSAHSRYGLVKRALARGDLIAARRGLYCLGLRHQNKSLNLFELAFRIYGPSYISCESALSFHGWIPESVFTVTSVSSERSREFKNDLGVFSYQHIPKKILYAGVDASFVASPWTALADLIYLSKKNWRGIRPLCESLRIEEDELRQSNFLGEYDELFENYPSLRVQKFLKSVRKDLV